MFSALCSQHDKVLFTRMIKHCFLCAATRVMVDMESNPQPRGLVSELDNRFAQIYDEFADKVTRDMIAASECMPSFLSVYLLWAKALGKVQ